MRVMGMRVGLGLGMGLGLVDLLAFDSAMFFEIGF